MEENQTPTSPIAGEPAVLKHIGFALDLVASRLKMFKHPENYYIHDPIVDEDDLVILQHHLVNAKYSVPGEPASPNARIGEPMTLPALKPGMVVPRGALMGLRASLAFAFAEYADTVDGWASIAGDLAHTIQDAMDQIDAMLGITQG